MAEAEADARSDQKIGGEEELQAFTRCPPGQRELTEPLRGLVAEMALTGVIRYNWPLMRPLLDHLMELQLRHYEESSSVEVGPARPVLLDGEPLDSVIERLRSYLNGFDSAPWTAQRLAELLLEPGKQYKQLHKLALALEKLLLVSSGVPTTVEPPPPPRLSDLRPVNENPPKVATAGSSGQQSGTKRSREDGNTGMGLVSATLGVRGEAMAGNAPILDAKRSRMGDLNGSPEGQQQQQHGEEQLQPKEQQQAQQQALQQHQAQQLEQQQQHHHHQKQQGQHQQQASVHAQQQTPEQVQVPVLQRQEQQHAEQHQHQTLQHGDFEVLAGKQQPQQDEHENKPERPPAEGQIQEQQPGHHLNAEPTTCDERHHSGHPDQEPTCKDQQQQRPPPEHGLLCVNGSSG